MTAISICSDFEVHENKVCHCFHFLPSICHEGMAPDAMILVSFNVQGRFFTLLIHPYQWLIHVDVWQKPTQFCRAIILQLKINKFNYFKKRVGGHQPERWKDGNYLAVQWLELHVLTVEGLGSIPGQGSHKLHGMTKKFLKGEKRETDLWTLWGKEGKG